MTTDQSLLNESRKMLERWVSYYDGKGHSAFLKEDTETLLAKLPQPPRYLPTDDEVARMSRNGED